MARKLKPEIREFILANLEEHPHDVGALTAKHFGVSRTTVGNYIKRLVEDGLVQEEGRTNAKKYTLKPFVFVHDTVEITPGMEDDEVWRKRILPAMDGIRPNVVDICHYGFTEMFNNVIDHSGSAKCMFWYQRDYFYVELGIRDFGVGIFRKIQNDFDLADPTQALLELSKGKLTSDPSKHTGEGIFFTSRMFDRFSLDSYELFYAKLRADAEWLIEIEQPQNPSDGTIVIMRIRSNTDRTSKEVFAQFMDDDLRFARTHVPLTLAKYGNEQLVSRSQARRLLARVENFSEVLLDFRGVESIGQAFADEIFRVYQKQHPGVNIVAINAVDAVDRMIQHAKVNASGSAASRTLLGQFVSQPPEPDVQES
jgi:DNA-binding transcriptional ArsR family regulator